MTQETIIHPEPTTKPAANGTALATYQETGGHGAISAFAGSGNFASAQRMARALAASSLVPDVYRGNIPNCLIALDMASRIGASVLATMQNLDIIHGKPGWRSTFLIATVNSSGRFTPLRFRFEGKPGTSEWGCRAVAKDKGDDEPCIGPLITMAIAKAEGWIDRKGSKWVTMPELMLTYRAAAFWTRIFAPEISLGMQTVDELADVGGPAVELPAGVAPGDAKALEAELLATPAAAPSAPASEPEAKTEEPKAKAAPKEPPPNAGDAWEG